MMRRQNDAYAGADGDGVGANMVLKHDRDGAAGCRCSVNSTTC
jgi:hypothetical protein